MQVVIHPLNSQKPVSTRQKCGERLVCVDCSWAETHRSSVSTTAFAIARTALAIDSFQAVPFPQLLSPMLVGLRLYGSQCIQMAVIIASSGLSSVSPAQRDGQPETKVEIETILAPNVSPLMREVPRRVQTVVWQI